MGDEVFTAALQFLVNQCERFCKLVCIGKILWFGQPKDIVCFGTGDIYDCTSYRNLNAFDLVKYEKAKFPVKLIKYECLLQTAAWFEQMC